MKRHCEGREEIFDSITGRMLAVNVYYEYVPGRTGTYRAEVAETIYPKILASTGNTYDEALERLQRRMQSQSQAS